MEEAIPSQQDYQDEEPKQNLFIPFVNIPRAERVADTKGDFYSYVLEVNDGSKDEIILRRYSQFSDLHTFLAKKFPQHKLPPFPTRTFFKASSKEAIESRRLILQTYIQGICQMEDVRSTPEFFKFLTEKPQVDQADFNANWKGKRVLVLGAHTEIGAEIACQYAGKGPLQVAVAGWDMDRIEKVVHRCFQLESGATVIPFIADLNKMEEIRKTLDGVVNSFKGIDIVVIVLGEGDMGPPHDAERPASFYETDDSPISTNPFDGHPSPPSPSHPRTYQKFEEIADPRSVEVQMVNTMNAMYYSAVYCAHFALPHLKLNMGTLRDESSLIVVSSSAGKTAIPNLALYSGAMHALHGFFDALRGEVTGVSVTMAYPPVKVRPDLPEGLCIEELGISAARIIEGGRLKVKEVAFGQAMSVVQGLMATTIHKA